jgi:hypothetical protein
MKAFCYSLFFIIIIVNKCLTTDKCSFETKSVRNNNCITLQNFDNFDELDFVNCSLTFQMSILNLFPNKKLILNSNLKLNGLKIQPIEKIFNIMLYNIQGIELTANPFQSALIVNYPMEHLFWTLRLTNFEFFYKNKSTSLQCNEILMNEKNWTNYIFISFIGYSLKNI